MCQNKIITIILLIIISYNGYAKEYKAYECITYVHFDWGDYTGDRFDILNDKAHYNITYNMLLFADKNNIKISRDKMIRDGSGMYLDFVDNCEQKTQMSAQIMQYYKNNIPNFPKYFVTEALIMPHRNTFLE